MLIANTVMSCARAWGRGEGEGLGVGVGVGVCVISHERPAEAEGTSMGWSPDADAYQPTKTINPKEQSPRNAKTAW